MDENYKDQFDELTQDMKLEKLFENLAGSVYVMEDE